MKWQVERLEKVTLKIGSGFTPFGGDSVYIDEGTTLIRSQNVYNSKFEENGLAFIGQDHADEMINISVEPEDILLNITGDSVARCCLAPIQFLPARVNQHVMIIRPDKNKLNSRFLMYYMISPYMQASMLSLAGSGGTRKALTKTMVEQFDIPLPSPAIQQKIASILSAYDDLIENNRRRIQLLEESARLLYREWFVDLRFPGHEHVKVKDGVPEGWESTNIEFLAETVGGGTPSTKSNEYWDDGTITWFTPTDLTKNDSIVLLNSERKITEDGLKNSSAKMLPPETILMSSRASIGYFGIYEFEACTNQGFISLIPKYDNLKMYLLFNLMNRVEEIIGLAGGTTYKEINKTTFRAIQILKPSPTILQEFEEYVYSIIQEVRCLKKQNKKLTEARDLLLPRLMNGEIEV